MEMCTLTVCESRNKCCRKRSETGWMKMVKREDSGLFLIIKTTLANSNLKFQC